MSECDKKRPELKRIILELKRESFRDQKVIDWHRWKLETWNFMILGGTLLGTLADRIDTNPFPSERLTLRKIAHRLMPDVGVSVWERIFSAYDLSAIADEKYYFEAVAEVFCIEEIEEELLQLVRGGFVTATAAREVLHWGPNSKTYQAVKRALEERGWKWQRTKTERRIVAPVG